jgi:coenzyme F420 biosynthesis associated uncharacterized protein
VLEDNRSAGSSGPLADWRLAEKVAWVVASADQPPATRDDVVDLRTGLGEAVRRADGLARAATGLGAELSPAECRVVGRREWIRSNLATVAALTDPVADRLVGQSGVARAVTRRVLGAQLGAVFGYLATKVLGQYEVFLPDPEAPGRLTLVGPNLLHVERTLLPSADVSVEAFRLGICLHEIAHRLQFEAVPWMRPYLRGMLDDYLDDIRLDRQRMRQIAERLLEILRDPAAWTDPQRLIDVILTPAQATTIRQAQALMSVLEGHGNVVMDWGAEVPAADGLDASRVREVLNRRRDRATDQALRRLLGLSMKAEQYRIGERFLFAVTDQHGREALARMWEGPQNLPSGDELRDPDAWAARVGAA